MKILFLYISLLIILSREKCLFHIYSNYNNIEKISINIENKSIEDYHSLKIYFDNSNIINEIGKSKISKIIKDLNEISDILSNLITIKKIQWIKYTNDKICNMKIKVNKKISEGINADLIIIPLIDNSINQVLGRMCLIDNNSKRSIINLLYLPQDLNYDKKEIYHQLFHILGFNASHIHVNKTSLVNTFYTLKNNIYPNLINYTFNSKTFDWAKKIFIKDIMFKVDEYEDLSELSISLLKDNKYIINECFIYKPINKNIIYYGIDLNNKLICYLNSKENIRKKQCGTNKFPLKSDILETSKNYNFKIYQSIYLLTPSKKCPNKHPRTVWFYNIKKYSNRTIPKKFKIEKFDITNEDYVVSFNLKRFDDCFYIAYKPTKDINGISLNPNIFKVNLYDEWNNYNETKILRTINRFNKYTHYTNYHFIYYFNDKDYLHRLYKNMNKKFPEDYNFMQETYILPEDKEIIKKKFKNYKLSNNNLWIYKPADERLGIGIKFLKNFTNINDTGVITKYIHNPLLLYGKKFDLRLYVLVTSFLPLKIYFNKEGLVRVTTNDYNLDEKNFNNSYIHFTHTLINMENKNFTHPEFFTDERGHLWSMEALKNYIERKGKSYDKLYNDIKDLIIKSIISAEDIFIKESREKYFGKRVSTLIGYDILIDDNLKPWLLEMNCRCPDLGPHNIVDEIIKTELMTSYLNIIGLVPFSHKNGKPLDDVYQYNNTIEEVVDDSLCEFERVDGSFERIFPKKDNIESYKKYFENPGKENELLWEKLQTFE